MMHALILKLFFSIPYNELWVMLIMSAIRAMINNPFKRKKN